MNKPIDKIQETRDYIKSRTKVKPEIALILGTGLGGFVDGMEVDISLPYNEIPNFPVSTAPGHAGQLVFGVVAEKSVMVMQGRFHFYEGYSTSDIVFPIRLMKKLGIDSMIVTNATGGLNPDFDAGDLMLIEDHINQMGINPLIGQNQEEYGPRFSDMSNAYDRDLQKVAMEIARQNGITLRQGTYIGVTGPSFETSAERRFLRMIGGDAIGMSTVPEVIVAVHAGMKVLGLSVITNKASGGSDQLPDSGEEVVEVAKVAGKKLAHLLPGIIGKM